MIDRAAPSVETLLETAVEAAREGGRVLLQHWHQDRQVEFKGTIDLVTRADRESEKAVVALIRNRFPTHQVLAEEGSTGGQSPDFRWIVDPLDGTTNYAHGYPHFSVSVAAEREGRVVAGAVYDPIRCEMFTGLLGGGAYVNKRPLRVSSSFPLLRSLICTGFPYDRDRFTETLLRWDYFIRHSQAVRRDGSAALDMCYVAAGRFDGFYEAHLNCWDIAAGALMVLEAGGVVTDYSGGSLDVYHGEAAASNGLIHQQLLAGIALPGAAAEPDGRGGG